MTDAEIEVYVRENLRGFYPNAIKLQRIKLDQITFKIGNATKHIVNLRVLYPGLCAAFHCGIVYYQLDANRVRLHLIN